MAEQKKAAPAKAKPKQEVAKEQEVPAQEQVVQPPAPTLPENAATELDEPAHEHAQRSASSIADQTVRGRWTQAKAVLYTDGISGTAEQNLERAYEYNERLQSNNPQVRQAGDDSLSDAAKEARDERDTREAQQVIDGGRL